MLPALAAAGVEGGDAAGVRVTTDFLAQALARSRARKTGAEVRGWRCHAALRLSTAAAVWRVETRMPPLLDSDTHPPTHTRTHTHTHSHTPTHPQYHAHPQIACLLEANRVSAAAHEAIWARCSPGE